MTVKRLFGRPTIVVLTAIGSLFFCAATHAASISLSWSSIQDPAVAGYEVYYGEASQDYTAYVDAGNNTSVTVPDLVSGVTYYLAVLAYDSMGNYSPYSVEIVQTINGAPPQPVITAAPLSQAVSAGTTASLAVSANSQWPVTYQWFDGTTALAGATNAILTLPNASDVNNGDYSVVISNGLGSVTSDAVTLSIIDPPVITVQPVSQWSVPGTNVNFYVAVSGTPPFSIQWFDGGTPIAMGTKATLHLSNVSDADAGNYRAVISNSAGSVTTSLATLLIMHAAGAAGMPLATVQPVAGAVMSGTAVSPAVPTSFVPLAGAYNGLFYQTNGSALPEITVQTAGLLANCVVGTNGNYSARLRVGGFSYPLAGALDMSGYDSEVVSRAAHGLSDLSVTLQLDTTGASGQITGLVSNMDTGNPWTALLLADLATNALPVPAGTFNMLITSAPSGTQTSGAGLSGSGWLVNSDVGQVTWAAVLPDGTFISKTVPLAKDGTIPFYAILYGGLGVAEGWINLANGVPTGSITWIHPGRAAAGQAAQGITTVLAVGSVPSLSN